MIHECKLCPLHFYVLDPAQAPPALDSAPAVVARHTRRARSGACGMEGAQPQPQAQPESSAVSFGSIGLDSRIVRALTRMRWARPTPVQTQCVTLALQGKDLLARCASALSPSQSPSPSPSPPPPLPPSLPPSPSPSPPLPLCLCLSVSVSLCLSLSLCSLLSSVSAVSLSCVSLSGSFSQPLCVRWQGPNRLGKDGCLRVTCTAQAIKAA